MLFLAVVALVMPAVFDLALYGTLAARPAAIDRLSLGSAGVLIGAYCGSLIYSFSAHRDLFRSAHSADDARLSATEAGGLLAAGTIVTIAAGLSCRKQPRRNSVASPSLRDVTNKGAAARPRAANAADSASTGAVSPAKSIAR